VVIYVNQIYNINQFVLQEYGDFTWRVSDCEELVGEVNHTTECVTDLFSFVDVEWRFL